MEYLDRENTIARARSPGIILLLLARIPILNASPHRTCDRIDPELDPMYVIAIDQNDHTILRIQAFVGPAHVRVTPPFKHVESPRTARHRPIIHLAETLPGSQCFRSRAGEGLWVCGREEYRQSCR